MQKYNYWVFTEQQSIKYIIHKVLKHNNVGRTQKVIYFFPHWIDPLHTCENIYDYYQNSFSILDFLPSCAISGMTYTG